MRIYLDMVSTEPPRYRGKDKSGAPWRAHAARIAMAVERDDRTIETTLLTLLRPLQPTGEGWPIDLPWITRYAGRIDDGDNTIEPWAVVDSLRPWLAAAAGPLGQIVAHNAPFHRSVLGGLIKDGGGFPGADDELEWFCTMQNASVAGMRQPSLLNAHTYLTGRRVDHVAAELPWDAAALQQINVLRAVYWAIRDWGYPDPIPLEDA